MPTDRPPHPGSRPFLSGALRVGAVVVAACAGAVVVVLGVRYSGDSTPSRVDGHLDRAVDTLVTGGYRLLREITEFGSPPFVAVAGTGIALGCLLCRRPRAAALALVGPGLTGLLTTVGKSLVGRTIGDQEGLAFPSGHTGGATSLALVVALLAATALELGVPGTAALASVCALAAGGTVGTGMILTGAHYPTDVVGGFCTAVAAVLATALVLDAVLPRSVRAPVGSRPRRDAPAGAPAVTD